MLRVGIFFGGQSREREIAFAGGRTVYDNLDKTLFEPVPVFVDSMGRFVLLDWQYLYKGSIRDFYPPSSEQMTFEHPFQVYIESAGLLDPAETERMVRQVGKPLPPECFHEYFDMAFLALHGPFGEDGNIQGLLEWYGIPYTGSGILPSAIGINKSIQKDLLNCLGYPGPKAEKIGRKDWLKGEKSWKENRFQQLQEDLGSPLVVKAPTQGSSIGVSKVEQNDFEGFCRAVKRSLFVTEVAKKDWEALNDYEKVDFVQRLIDIREGIGLPVRLGEEVIYDPDELMTHLEFAEAGQNLLLESLNGESHVLIEAFLEGKEFSCIVVEDESEGVLALPPTEIRKTTEVFDYRAKYLPGISRKVTPIDLPHEQLQAIRRACVRLFHDLHFDVYARLDGFIDDEGEVFLNDPNTTSGMMPSSFFFHQAAEVGLDPSQFLTFILRNSLHARVRTGKNISYLERSLERLDQAIESRQQGSGQRTKVAVILGGYSSERHISVESGRNIYEKLASSAQYEPYPVFLTGNSQRFELFRIPINILLKDNADDIREKIEKSEQSHHLLEEIREEAEPLTRKYAGQPLQAPQKLQIEDLAQAFDAVFIALHGRPGEDGTLQDRLEKQGLPYNGSRAHSSAVTINKYETNERLEQAGFRVARHRKVEKSEWENRYQELLRELEAAFGYPFIAKPADDGCSSAVKMMRHRQELEAYLRLIFREEEALTRQDADVLGLAYHEEFPRKTFFLVEELIGPADADHFLEITGGLLTHYQQDGSLAYEMFEPSEALSQGDVLSLEEKFLAGQGQNITPARLSKDPEKQATLSQQVRQTLKAVAQTMELEGYARIDAFVRIWEAEPRAEVIIIEINSLPGMTPATAIFHQCALNGYKPLDFIDQILQFGRARSQRLDAEKTKQ